MSSTAIFWCDRDFRICDNPALACASSEFDTCVCVYIHDSLPLEGVTLGAGAASNWWLHHSLISFSSQLRDLGIPLIIRQGSTLEGLLKLVKESKADAVFWNRRYEPELVKRDSYIKQALREFGVRADSFHGNLLIEPWKILNKSKKPFRVFTPFWNALKSDYVAPEPKRVTPHETSAISLDSLRIEDLGLLPTIKWDYAFYKEWEPGEPNAIKALRAFLLNSSKDYDRDRDIPSIRASSRLSPALHFGEISVHDLWREVKAHIDTSDTRTHDALWSYLRQIAWREFAANLLFHNPSTPSQPLRSEFSSFPWRPDADFLSLWQKGQTGIPLVDAGMRELWQTGWMHNRVRMVAASFLVKQLLQPWQDGAKWFWDTLLDADLANNSLGWQWVAGCGADAAPYFRIFNPILQGEKFDPNGTYVRTWVPELSAMPNKWIHRPWQAPTQILVSASITLGTTYPRPCMDPDEGRTRALMAYDKMKKLTEKNFSR